MKRNSQRGSALMVALMLLLIITVIGLNLATAGKLDLAAVGAYQNKKQTQEAAYAAIDSALAMEPPALDAPPHTYTVTDAQGITVTVERSYETTTEPPLGGYSKSEGFSAFHYRVRATAAGMNNAQARVEQGYYVLGPAS